MFPVTASMATCTRLRRLVFRNSVKNIRQISVGYIRNVYSVDAVNFLYKPVVRFLVVEVRESGPVRSCFLESAE
jgi:hypothetical protein